MASKLLDPNSPPKHPGNKWAWHEFKGLNPDSCERCGKAILDHREKDTRDRTGRKDMRKGRVREPDQNMEWIGIDGEGQGRDNHKYVFLAASNETQSRKWSVENPNGLTTHQCLDFIISLPSWHARTMAYSFNYDITKILVDLPNDKLYKLMRPELRKRRGKEAIKGPIPVRWDMYTLNMQGTKFSVGITGQRHRVIWDVWKFFQSKFVEALKDWKVGDPEVLARMQRMKDLRAEFDKLDLEEVKAYCFDECAYMATLARKLFEAHTAVELRLKNFYGAGSSASAMLDKMNLKPKLVPTPKKMETAVAQAFFGGRFEHSVIGKIEKHVYNWDISSAYPYQLCFLPCLEHGTWELTKSRDKMERSRHALIHYVLSVEGIKNVRVTSWAPFPFREPDGSISYPRICGGGWLWKDEYQAGEKCFPHIEFKEAWVLNSDCNCQPFKDIPKYYRERVRIGKEGPGIVLKLGQNSVYGKLAQSVGEAQFNSWIWAGMITSGCRAQILDMMALHRNRSNLLMVATDGIFTLENITPPKPKDTGTDLDITDQSTGKVLRKPLGGWELKEIPQGIFVARPGVYFPLNPTKEEIKIVRGRGVGKGVVLENWKVILDSWETTEKTIATTPVEKQDADFWKASTVQVKNVSRFCGAKTCISRSGPPSAYTYKRAEKDTQLEIFPDDKNPKKERPAYGQWIVRPVTMSFNPLPKRAGVLPNGRGLSLRELPLTAESTPYKKALRSQISREMEAQRLIMMEQPDVDLADYEFEDD